VGVSEASFMPSEGRSQQGRLSGCYWGSQGGSVVSEVLLISGEEGSQQKRIK